MGRSRVAREKEERERVKLSITLDADLYDWLAKRTGPAGEFANISHGIDRCIAAMKSEVRTDRALIEELIAALKEQKKGK